MLKFKFSGTDILVADVSDNTMNVADVDTFAKSVNTVLAYTKLCQLGIKEGDNLTFNEEYLKEQLEKLFKEGHILCYEDKDKEQTKVYTIPVYNKLSDIPKEIIRQVYYYCIAANNGNVCTGIVYVNGKPKLSRAYVREYLTFWDYCLEYHRKGEDDAILEEAVTFVRQLGEEFNIAEENGLLRRYNYSVSRSNVRKAMNIAVEVLGMGNDGNIRTRTVKGKNSASVQLACLLFHFKPTTKQVKVRTQIEI